MKVSISRKAAQAILDNIDWRNGDSSRMVLATEFYRAVDELRRALAPRPKSSQRKKTERKKRDRQAETRSIYEQVEERAGGKCECCGLPFSLSSRKELDHFIPRRHGQTVGSCWMLCGWCHRKKTENTPSAAHWLERFITHAIIHGYDSERDWAQRRLNGIVSMREASR